VLNFDQNGQLKVPVNRAGVEVFFCLHWLSMLQCYPYRQQVQNDPCARHFVQVIFISPVALGHKNDLSSKNASLFVISYKSVIRL
jgi:hypothetical protein